MGDLDSLVVAIKALTEAVEKLTGTIEEKMDSLIVDMDAIEECIQETQSGNYIRTREERY